jgi:predicted CoA-binding protein
MNSEKDSHSDCQLREIYNFKNIAVVGMSTNPAKAGHFVPKYLMKVGYNIIPVNPNSSEILGLKSFSKVSEINLDVEIVDVFRKSEDVSDVVLDTLKKSGIKVIWLQEGIHNKEAEQTAKSKGIDVVFNRCMMAEHIRLFGT